MLVSAPVTHQDVGIPLLVCLASAKLSCVSVVDLFTEGMLRQPVWRHRAVDMGGRQ